MLFHNIRRVCSRQTAFLISFQKRPLPFFHTFILFAILIIFTLFSSVSRSAADDDTELPDVGEPPSELVAGLNNDAGDGETAVQQASSDHYVYLPFVTKPPTCTLNDEEQQIADLTIAHPDQGRTIMNCSPILSQVAREKAQDMATRQFFSHVNPDGEGPNYLVTQAGYTLPSWYGSAMGSNNIESIAAGYTTAAAAWSGWMASSGHRAHLLAEASFWADQTNYGIGYYYDANSPYRHYWVFLSAPPEE